MENRQTQNNFAIEGRITARTHSEQNLRDAVDNYDSLSEEERLELTREVEPEREFRFTNTVVAGLLEYIVDNLDPGQTGATTNVEISHLALGTDNETPEIPDEDLDNRQFQKQVTDVNDDGATLETSTFVGSSEANGLDLKEVGLYTGDPANLNDNDVFMLNHSTFSPVTKTQGETVTFDVNLQFTPE